MRAASLRRASIRAWRLALGFRGFAHASFVLGLVQGHNLVRCFFQSVCAVAQFGVGAAAFFAGVRWQLDTINSKHVSTNQPLCITGQQDLAEQGFDLRAQVGDELSNVGMAGLAVAADGDELDVALACLFDDSAGDQTLAVGQQHDLEHNAGIVSAGTDFIVFKPCI